MKGQAELLIERAINQARREADLLYLLIAKANAAVLESRLQRDREYVLLLGYLAAVIDATHSRQEIEFLRRGCLMFIESVLVLDSAISGISSECLEDHPVLFRDTAKNLRKQLQMVIDLSTRFNQSAIDKGAVELDLDHLRSGLQSQTNRKIASWVNLARVEMLGLFGTTLEMCASVDSLLQAGTDAN